MNNGVVPEFSAQIGELLHHGVNVDPGIVQTSDWYFDLISALLKRHPLALDAARPRYLEVACYRHIVGYRMAKELGFEATQFDISHDDLEAGRALAIANGHGEDCERVAGDFHDLPFADGYFDLAVISASIHHTRTPERVIGEMMRVLADGGLFYCQREPCERLFSFYAFNCNRRAYYTPFEAHLAKRDMLRVISSPVPGARNADVFGRVENDRIPLDFYFDIFARYGELVEEVVYHEGLLTGLDKEILAQDQLSERKLAGFIADRLRHEFDLARPLMSDRDRLLGYSLPGDSDIADMAKRVAAALKARPKNEKSLAWRREMARIFGGSLRFVVRRQASGKPRSDEKYRRSVTRVGTVLGDDAVYGLSGLEIWNKLLPDLQEAPPAALQARIFPPDCWHYVRQGDGVARMFSTGDGCRINVPADRESLVVMRYSIDLDDELSAARVHMALDDESILDDLIPQPEDRCASFICPPGEHPLSIRLTDADGNPVETGDRIRVTVLQAVPVSGTNGGAEHRAAPG